MGGAGKTTLLKEINNEYLTRTQDFEAVIWVTVSKDFGVDRIQYALLSRLGLSYEETEIQEWLVSRIYNFMRRIKFLLLLDDIWQSIDLEKVGVRAPDKKNRCKVVFTTRSMDVCSDMDANQKFKVDFLCDEDSWRLFCDEAGMLSNSDIEPYARAIVKNCEALPLAFINVGWAMANRNTEEEWKYALEVLNNAPSEFRGMEDFFVPLRFSYDNLHDSTLKMCFLYCALFPEDYPLAKEKLLLGWGRGHAIMGSLKLVCLLESGEDENQVNLHDVVRSFALWVASGGTKRKEKFLVQACRRLTELPELEKWEQAERISLVDKEITTVSRVPSCPNLLTLLLNCNRGLSKISNDFFQFIPVLKVLDLSVTNIREIPESIVSRVTALGFVKDYDNYTARTVGMFMENPTREAILGLSNLGVFNLYYSFEEWEKPDCGVVFQDLQNLSHLISLGITVIENSSLKKLYGFHHLLNCIEYLYIKGCQRLIYPMEIDLGSEEGNDWLPWLEVLALHTLPSLTGIWILLVTPKCHRNLRYVNMWYCPKLKNISWILELPCLETVYVFYCDGMEKIIEDNVVIESPSKVGLPKLKTVCFRSLPQLRCIASAVLAFPMLQTIALIDCPQLKKLPTEGCDPSNPPRVYCTREWWDNLEWDDPTASSLLHPQFIAC
ncbi:LOW QUALITY PROTEIN: hypothetical protein Cgig2_013498 [Carnegiea gigantea]|uniref:NB-ARC domain-containing protein n=1 Tax=Carnegiea gigantea TaxID=171969 RepID=A0A9Q1K217_9CARY|nr:LOW QUALITY PROTEIN: hypothetical protein Cgig2_013498 [Carnegiea gigantea]